ncbi:MAG: VCBS repeat-containing protein, partial [Planctomycetes bacterium]|nr:VCBS repeat-containing protein [Planctomycetota bacterium]
MTANGLRVSAYLAVAGLLTIAPNSGPRPLAASQCKYFEERAVEWGLDHPGKRVVWGDLDGDGWLDCILDGAQVLLSRAAGDDGEARRFADATVESGLNAPVDGGGEERRASFVLLGDVDGDGDLDVFSAYYCDPENWKPDPANKEEPLKDADGNLVPLRADDGHRSEILRNDGHARFARVPDSGVNLHAETIACAAFFDYDLDGNLDLYAGNWYRSYNWSQEAYPSRLYRGRGDGRFEDVTEAAGMRARGEVGYRDSARPIYGATSGDWNDDGFPDLYACAYGRQWNQLWRNNGDGTFTDVAESTGFDGDANRSGHYPPHVKRAQELPFRSNGNTFDCALADFDNDGDLDAFLAEITHAWAGSSSDRSTLLVNLGAGEAHRFERNLDLGIAREHAAENWNQGDLYAGWIDADGDGLLDLLIASGDYPDDQRLRLFAQGSDHRFREATLEHGFVWEGCGGISIGDADNDGDPDLLIGRSLARLPQEKAEQLGARVGLWLHPSGPDVRWAKVRVRGKGAGGANRDGIGCRVTVSAGGRRQIRELHGAAGHAGHQ